MLQYVTGNIFDSPAQTLVNTVNTVGVMGKGIALDFKQRYPEMFGRYAAFCKAEQFKTGMLYLYRTPNKWVLNFPTKKHWRNPSKIEYIEEGLKKFVDTYSEQGITSISFPQLGCGNGGLQWKEAVAPLMAHYLGKLSIPVYIHVRNSDEKFVPEHLANVNEINSARQSIGFVEFLRDFLNAAGATDVPSEKVLWTRLEAEDGIAVRVPIAGQVRELHSADLEVLWNGLRIRGSLEEASFPPTLRDLATPILSLMTKLDYVKPMTFAGYEGPRIGVKFAPLGTNDRNEVLSSEVIE